MKLLKTAVVVTLGGGIALAGVAVAQEKKIKRSDLPAAVEKTVAAESVGANIRGFTIEMEDGTTYYEMELMLNGHTKDVLMDSTGAVTEVEEEVSLDGLPASVKAALLQKAGKSKIVKVESLTKHNKLVAYEAQLRDNGKKSEIQVGPEGQTLSHEE